MNVSRYEATPVDDLSFIAMRLCMHGKQDDMSYLWIYQMAEVNGKGAFTSLFSTCSLSLFNLYSHKLVVITTNFNYLNY